MPISGQHAGRRYPPTPVYEVSAAKVEEFSAALGSMPDGSGVAPPTFAAVVAARAWQSMFDDPELGLALRRVVHGDQRFDYVRPLRVGDRVQGVLTLDRVRSRGPADIVTTTVAVVTEQGEPVCTATATFFHTREADA